MNKIGFAIMQFLAKPKAKVAIGVTALVALAVYTFATGEWEVLRGPTPMGFPPPWIW